MCPQCITNSMKLAGFGSSLTLPDRVLTFVRDHPLMDQPVRPLEHAPLVVQRGAPYHRVAVHRVRSLTGTDYDVLFLGTGEWQRQGAAGGEGTARESMSCRQGACGLHRSAAPPSPGLGGCCGCALTPVPPCSEDGHLHKAVKIGPTAAIIEDLTLFPEPRPVQNLQLHQVRGSVLTVPSVA